MLDKHCVCVLPGRIFNIMGVPALLKGWTGSKAEKHLKLTLLGPLTKNTESTNGAAFKWCNRSYSCLANLFWITRQYEGRNCFMKEQMTTCHFLLTPWQYKQSLPRPVGYRDFFSLEFHTWWFGRCAQWVNHSYDQVKDMLVWKTCDESSN